MSTSTLPGKPNDHPKGVRDRLALPLQVQTNGRVSSVEGPTRTPRQRRQQAAAVKGRGGTYRTSLPSALTAKGQTNHPRRTSTLLKCTTLSIRGIAWNV